MFDEPRTYRHSTSQLVILFLVFGVLAVGLVSSWDKATDTSNIVIAALFVVILLSSLYTMTVKTIISNDEISTQTILGTRTLNWAEINRVTGWGHSIKLQNMNGDVTVAPNPQLAGYEEVVEFIGSKRPDLFSPQEYSEMKIGFNFIIPMAGLALALIGLLVASTTIQMINASYTSFIVFAPLLLLIVALFVFFWMSNSLPQSLTLADRSLTLKYLFSEKVLLVNEINSINLRHTQTRNGKNYFIAITFTNKKYIRISGLGPNLPVVFLVLRNWHKKHTAIRQTTQRD
jgi:hypothetical protein